MAFPYTTVNNVISIIKDEKSKDRQFATIKLTSLILPKDDDTEPTLRFCLQVVAGDLKVGDIIQISAFKKWRGSASEDSRHKNRMRDKRLRNLIGLVITEDMIKSSSYKTNKTIKVEMKLSPAEVKHLVRSYNNTSADSAYGHPIMYNKVIRIRRPIYNDKGLESDSIFSNLIPINLAVIDFSGTPTICWISSSL